jgi:hypothetical protein
MLQLDSAEQLGLIEGDECRWTSRTCWAAVIDTWQVTGIADIK